MQHVIYVYTQILLQWKTTFKATTSLSGWLMKPISEMSFHHIFTMCFYCVFILFGSFDNKVLDGTVSGSSAGCVFFCCLLISLLRWPNCYVITEGGWLVGPEEVIRNEFTDSLTSDIRGASFSHAPWSPGSDSTKASGLRGSLTGPQRPANTCHPLTPQAQ